jgi:hypothetical protein
MSVEGFSRSIVSLDGFNNGHSLYKQATENDVE